MVSTIYRRLFVPVVVVATLALVGAGVLLVVRPPGHGALLVIAVTATFLRSASAPEGTSGRGA